MYTKFIAEAGVNHNGKISTAKKLIKVAADSGADFIKFQAFKTECLIIEGTKKARYQEKNTFSNEDQFQMLKKLEFNEAEFNILSKVCKKNKIKFLLSVFDEESLNIIKKLRLKTIKIPSGEINNYFLLSKLAKLRLKIILSTGMSNIKEIKDAIKILTSEKINKKDITILQCTSDYPTKFKDVNLKVIDTLKKKFKTNVGLSDHTLGKLSSITASILGASVIEKHFTLNKKDNGPDHKASLSPKELKELIYEIKSIPVLIGNSKKRSTKNEILNKLLVRKSIVAKKNIKKGERFSLSNLTAKRPGTGISPMRFKFFRNKKSKKNYKKDEFIK